MKNFKLFFLLLLTSLTNTLFCAGILLEDETKESHLLCLAKSPMRYLEISESADDKRLAELYEGVGDFVPDWAISDDEEHEQTVPEEATQKVYSTLPKAILLYCFSAAKASFLAILGLY